MRAALPLQRLIPAGGLALLAAAIGVLAGINPMLALAGALAATFALVAVADLYAGVVLFILATSVAESPGLVGGGVTVAKFAGGILVISWLARLATRREAKSDLPSAHPLATWVLVLFLCWVGVSQLWAEDPAASRDALVRLALNAMLFVIVFTAVRTRSQALGVIAAFVVGACLDAAYGLVNPVDVANEARLAGTASKPGELAASLVAGLVLSLGLAAALKGKPIARLVVQGAAGLCALGVFFTGSRGGLIALAVALAAFVAIGGRWRGRMLILTCLVVVAGLGFFNYAASPDLRDRVYTLGGGSGRVDLWTVGWRMVEDEPVTGIGSGNFRTSSPDYVLEPGALAGEQYFVETPQVAHNTYLEVWAETGLVGLALFAFIVAFCLRTALLAAREFARQHDAAMEMMSRAVFAGMAGFLAGAFFTSRLYEKDVWLVLALGPALWGVARAQVEASRSPGALVRATLGSGRRRGLSPSGA